MGRKFNSFKMWSGKQTTVRTLRRKDFDTENVLKIIGKAGGVKVREGYH